MHTRQWGKPLYKLLAFGLLHLHLIFHFLYCMLWLGAINDDDDDDHFMGKHFSAWEINLGNNMRSDGFEQRPP